MRIEADFLRVQGLIAAVDAELARVEKQRKAEEEQRKTWRRNNRQRVKQTWSYDVTMTDHEDGPRWWATANLDNPVHVLRIVCGWLPRWPGENTDCDCLDKEEIWLTIGKGVWIDLGLFRDASGTYVYLPAGIDVTFHVRERREPDHGCDHVVRLFGEEFV